MTRSPGLCCATWRYNAEVHQGKEEGCVGGSGCWRVSSWQGMECSRSTKQPEGQLSDHTSQETPSPGRNLRFTRPTSLASVRISLLPKATGCFEVGEVVAMRRNGAPEGARLWLHIPVSMGDDDQGSSELLCSNTHPGTGASPEAVGTCCYPCSGSSADAAKQWGLFPQQVLFSAQKGPIEQSEGLFKISKLILGLEVGRWSKAGRSKKMIGHYSEYCLEWLK